MELRHLRYFVAVAEEASFTGAANKLNTAQPSLSKQIRDLELKVGVHLLVRDKRRVKLTPSGDVFLNEARLVLAQADRAINMARRAADSDRPNFSIGFVPAAEVKIFPRAIGALRSQFPETRFVMQSLTTYESLQGLLSGEVDVGFLRPPIVSENLSYEIVLQEHLVAVLPKEHPAANQSEVSLAELVDTPFLRIAQRHAGELSELTERLIARENITLKAVQDTENVLTLLSLVGMGVGFGILPDYAGLLSLGNIVARPIRGPRIHTSLAMAWRRDSKRAEIESLRSIISGLAPAERFQDQKTLEPALV